MMSIKVVSLKVVRSKPSIFQVDFLKIKFTATSNHKEVYLNDTSYITLEIDRN